MDKNPQEYDLANRLSSLILSEIPKMLKAIQESMVPGEGFRVSLDECIKNTLGELQNEENVVNVMLRVFMEKLGIDLDNPIDRYYVKHFWATAYGGNYIDIRLYETVIPGLYVQERKVFNRKSYYLVSNKERDK